MEQYKIGMQWYIIDLLLFLAVLLLGIQFNEVTASSEGRHFAIAFPAGGGGYSKIYIHAKQPAVVRITTFVEQSFFNIEPEETFIYEVTPYEFRVTEGVENKGILIDAASDVSVTLSNANSDNYMDTTLALPRYDGLNEYAVITYATDESSICLDGTTASFYIVAAYEDNTTVSIYRTYFGDVEFLQEITIDKLAVYTNRSLTGTGEKYDFTGHYITANKPISVTAGDSCSHIGLTEGPIWAFMPNLATLSTSYLTHAFHYVLDYEYYLIRVLAVYDDTDITFERLEVSQNLYLGRYVTYEISANAAEMISCSKPCLVAQYSQSSRDDPSSISMIVVPPTVDSYIDSVIFTLPYTSAGFEIEHHVNIIFNTSNPRDTELLLDGFDISTSSDWMRWGDDLYVATVSVSGEEISHQLISTDPDHPFSAMVHGHGLNGRGYANLAGIRINLTTPYNGCIGRCDRKKYGRQLYSSEYA